MKSTATTQKLGKRKKPENSENSEQIDESWKLKDVVKMQNLVSKLHSSNTIYPPINQTFRTLTIPISKVKVVILGQDPYHQANQANGLAFSVNRSEKIPPSLRNIYKELNRDLNINIPTHGDLSRWFDQGVLLLNTSLTVLDSKPNIHSNLWKDFTDDVIAQINKTNSKVVFMLWGLNAAKKGECIDKSKHLVLITSHPSPLSVRHGFAGSSCFSAANKYLKENGKDEIDWKI